MMSEIKALFLGGAESIHMRTNKGESVVLTNRPDPYLPNHPYCLINLSRCEFGRAKTLDEIFKRWIFRSIEKVEKADLKKAS